MIVIPTLILIPALQVAAAARAVPAKVVAVPPRVAVAPILMKAMLAQARPS